MSTSLIPKHNIIFLDIDGVLNTHQFNEIAGSNLIDYSKVQLLNKIILATDARIVLSSAWRYIYHRGEANLIGLDWLLRSHGMACVQPPPDHTGEWNESRIIGVTHYNRPTENERGKQITKWLNNNSSRINNYVVIDDGGYHPETKVWTDLGIYAEKHPTVWCRSTVGLTEFLATQAIYALNRSR